MKHVDKRASRRRLRKDVREAATCRSAGETMLEPPLISKVLDGGAKR
jgi:hypothetical protein